MFTRTSAVDGKTYAIGFEMRLPKAWNGRFFHQGNGGIDGSVSTATGALGRRPAHRARCCRASRYSVPTPATATRRAGRPSASTRRHGWTTATRPSAKLTPIGQGGDRAGLRQGPGPLVLRRLLERRTPHAGGRGTLRATSTTASSPARRATTCRTRRWPTSSARSATRSSWRPEPASTPADLATAFTRPSVRWCRRPVLSKLRRARRRERRPGAGHHAPARPPSTCRPTCRPAAARATAAA